LPGHQRKETGGAAWLPTIVGAMVAFAAVPLYALLRRHRGASGLATARLFGICELAKFERMLLRRLKLGRPRLETPAAPPMTS
jgi:hypothetical protein